jgi:hypothetical protein
MERPGDRPKFGMTFSRPMIEGLKQRHLASGFRTLNEMYRRSSGVAAVWKFSPARLAMDHREVCSDRCGSVDR